MTNYTKKSLTPSNQACTTHYSICKSLTSTRLKIVDATAVGSGETAMRLGSAESQFFRSYKLGERLKRALIHLLEHVADLAGPGLGSRSMFLSRMWVLYMLSSYSYFLSIHLIGVWFMSSVKKTIDVVRFISKSWPTSTFLVVAFDTCQTLKNLYGAPS
jgi:hypothetical protein